MYTERYDEFIALLKERLDEYRFVHSLNVAKAARELAVLFGADEEKAYVAGLLHDATKCEKKENQLQMLKKGGIILSQVEENNPKLWHAMTAPLYLKDVLGVEDEEILSAVRYHTTGKRDMSLLDMIVYIADYISEERNYPDVEVMRRFSRESLEKGALYSLKYTLNKLSRDELVIHNDSLSFYNDLIIKGVSLKEEN